MVITVPIHDDGPIAPELIDEMRGYYDVPIDAVHNIMPSDDGGQLVSFMWEG